MWLLDRLLGRPYPVATVAQQIIKMLRDSGESRSITWNEADQMIQIGDGDNTASAYLGNFYAEYCAAPVAQRPAVI
jgi:predicted flavoprotein YhiN